MFGKKYTRHTADWAACWCWFSHLCRWKMAVAGLRLLAMAVDCIANIKSKDLDFKYI